MGARMLPERTEVVVIGGGVVGASSAYFLAKAGVKVLLLDKADRSGQASAANAAWVWSLTRRPGIDLDLAIHSIAIHRQLQKELKLDPEYRRHGGLLVASEEEEIPHMMAHAEARRDCGHPLQYLDRDQTLAHEPLLTPRVLGSLYCPDSGSTNPIRLTLSLLEAAAAHGAVIRTGTGVTGIEVQKGKMRSVSTRAGAIKADLVINAAGAWAASIGKMAGVEVPVSPYKMTMLVTEQVPPTLSRVLMGASYMVGENRKSGDESDSEAGCALIAGQQVAGNMLLGATWARVGYEKRTTYREITSIAAENAKFLPGLKGVRVIRSFANFFPFTQDDLPILGRVKGVEGFIMAAGHNGHGVCLGPGSGKLIQELITSGRPELDIGPLSLDRFESLA